MLKVHTYIMLQKKFHKIIFIFIITMVIDVHLVWKNMGARALVLHLNGSSEINFLNCDLKYMNVVLVARTDFLIK